MQPQDFIQRQFVFASLQHSSPPSLKTGARRFFAFDLEAGAAVRTHKEACRTRDHLGAGVADGFLLSPPAYAR